MKNLLRQKCFSLYLAFVQGIIWTKFAKYLIRERLARLIYNSSFFLKYIY